MIEERSSWRKAWLVFVGYTKVMLFAFTGGSMTLPLQQRQLSDDYKLIDRDKILEYYALGQSLPGIISVNSGIFIGREIAGVKGAIAAILGCVFPAFFGMLAITLSYTLLKKIEFISGAIIGIRVASVAIILANGLLLINGKMGKFGIAVAIMAFLTTFILGWNIALVIIGGGLLGVVREFLKSKGGRSDAV